MINNNKQINNNKTINNNKNKMIMKKNYLLIAAAAAMFAACSSNEIKNDVQDFGESAITFSSYANYQTKADNSNQTNHDWLLEDHHDDFDVWAWKYYNNAWIAEAVYDKGTVTYSSSAWAASPLKFWDKSADKYYFYAAAPSSANWQLENKYTASTNENGNNAYLSYADFTLAGGATNNLSYGNTTVTAYVPSFKDVADVDLMIAEDNEVLRATYNTTPVPAVHELFDHILSRLNVTVSLLANGTIATLNSDDNNANDVEVIVTNFGITGVSFKNKGTFNENGAVNTAPYTGATLSGGTTARWTSLSTEGTYNLPGASISATALTTSALYIAQYLIIPQSITSEVLDRAKAKLASNGTTDPHYPYFVISYTIGGEPYTAYYNLANAFGKAAGATLAFNEGWQNTLNIKLDADVIQFDAQVYRWADDENSTDITIGKQ